MPGKTKVVIIGAGFAGLYAARTLSRSADVAVTLIDKNNYHMFTPLIYQVATAALDPSAIAQPIRSIFRRKKNVRFLLGSVQAVDHDAKTVHVCSEAGEHTEPFDYLLMATGSKTNYFGQEAIEKHAFPLKDLDDAIRLRHHILKLFERAAWSEDADERRAQTTLVVVGGGPTGIETAGALYELYNHVLRHEFHETSLHVRVILLEAQDRLLLAYPPRLQEAAREQLESIGVVVMLNAMVQNVTENEVHLNDGRVIGTHTLVWAAGVRASSTAELMNVELSRGGRIPVTSQMQVVGLEDKNVYAAGDITYLEDAEGKPYPQVIPVAKQQGILAAKNMLRDMRREPKSDFKYVDRGIMATIGRSRAVAWIFYRVQLTGFVAWLSWLFLHLVVLLGFRNRLTVFGSWVWNYVTYDRSVRIIVEGLSSPRATEEQAASGEAEADDKAVKHPAA